MEDNTIASGSNDKSVKLWDIRNGRCTSTFNDHDSKVNSVCLRGDRLVSGDSNGVRYHLLSLPLKI